MNGYQYNREKKNDSSLEYKINGNVNKNLTYNCIVAEVVINARTQCILVILVLI